MSYPYLVGDPQRTFSSLALKATAGMKNSKEDGRTYILAQNGSGIATAEGDLMYWKDATCQVLTNASGAIDGTLGSCNRPAAIAVSAVPDTEYGYFALFSGNNPVKCKNDGTVTAVGDYLMGPNVAAPQATKALAGGEHCVFGRVVGGIDSPTDGTILAEIWIEPA